MSRDLIATMTDAGCLVEWFRPPTPEGPPTSSTTARTARCSSSTTRWRSPAASASPRSGRATPSDPSEWRDTHVRIRGPAVDGLRAAFVDELGRDRPRGRSTTGDVPSAPERRGLTPALVVASERGHGWAPLPSLLESLILLAHERLRITCAYFVPDDRFIERLCEAARRGVDCRDPGSGHARRQARRAASPASTTYEELLRGGVPHLALRAHDAARQDRHDGRPGRVRRFGNFDERSLAINEECQHAGLRRRRDRAAGCRLRRGPRRTARRSTSSDFEDRGFLEKLAERVAGLVKGKL